MGAERDPRLRGRRTRSARGRQVAGDVVAGPLLANDRRGDGDRCGGHVEPGRMRVARVEDALRLLERLAGAGEDRRARGAADARGDDPRAGERRVERHRHRLAGVRRSRTGDDQHRFRAPLPRRHRLVAQVGVARQDPLRLLVGVLGEVAQDEDDLVFHVERRVAVVAEVLAVGHDDAVAGEDDLAADFTVVGKRQRLDRRSRCVNVRLPGGDAQARTAVACAGGELERQPVIGLARQRPRADALQLRHEIVGREPLTVRPGEPPFLALAGERGHVWPRGRLRRGSAPRAVEPDGEGASQRGGESRDVPFIACPAFSAARS